MRPASAPRNLTEVDRKEMVATTVVVSSEIIIITCLHDLDSRIMGLELGVDDFLVKPIRRPELTARIRALLEKKQQLNNLRAHYETALN